LLTIKLKIMRNKKRIMRLPLLLIELIVVFIISSCSSRGSFNDPRDGKVYKTVKIGNQVWMAENLAYAPSSGNYWVYNFDDENLEIYGYLYDWNTALNVCPPGWRLPSNKDWKEMEITLGMSQADAEATAGSRGTNEGSKLAGNAALWTEGALVNNEYFDKSGFSALPGGARWGIGDFNHLVRAGLWWSSADLSGTHAWLRSLRYNDSNVNHRHGFKISGFSVRCIRDNVRTDDD